MDKLELTAYKAPLQRASNDMGALCTATVKKTTNKRKEGVDTYIQIFGKHRNTENSLKI